MIFHQVKCELQKKSYWIFMVLNRIKWDSWAIGITILSGVGESCSYSTSTPCGVRSSVVCFDLLLFFHFLLQNYSLKTMDCKVMKYDYIFVFVLLWWHKKNLLWPPLICLTYVPSLDVTRWLRTPFCRFAHQLKSDLICRPSVIDPYLTSRLTIDCHWLTIKKLPKVRSSKTNIPRELLCVSSLTILQDIKPSV